MLEKRGFLKTNMILMLACVILRKNRRCRFCWQNRPSTIFEGISPQNIFSSFFGIREMLLGIRKMFLGIRKMFLGIRKNIEAGMQENMVFKNMVGHGVCGDALGHAHHIFKKTL